MKEIIITGSVALSGVRKIIEKKKIEISDKYPERVMRKIITCPEVCTDISDYRLSDKSIYSKQLGEGGLFAGLWDMSKELNTGFHVDMSRVPVLQETIEICEMFNINPYCLESKRAWLSVIESSDDYPDGVTVIGRLEDSNDKKLLLGDRVRFLDRPAPDELLKVL